MSQSPSMSPLLLPHRRKFAGLIAPSVFIALALAMLRSVLFQRGTSLPSSPSDDLVMQFLPWRDFGFGQLKQGHFPLWNPYVFGGTPYFAGFQSALLYPPNWLHLLLSLTTAINWIIALHLFGAGYFTYLWCRGRGTSIGGSILAGIMFMFSGPYFLHIYAGHLPHLCVMIWAPLLFLSIDKLNETGALQWCFLGTLAATMQILGGHPQYLFYTGLISGLYVAISIYHSKNRFRLCGGFVLIYVSACLLAAVQLLAGLQAAGESVRSGGTDFAFASMFALPPENLLTFLAPGLLGSLPVAGAPTNIVRYFGRCYLWEMSVFVSVTGLVLFFFGTIVMGRKSRRLSAMILITLALALGKHLPIYKVLFDYFPEYGTFRSVSKFTYLMCLFICVLAGDGFDVVRTHRRAVEIGIAITGMLALAIVVVAMNLKPSGSSNGTSTWENVLMTIAGSNESYVPLLQYTDGAFIRDSAKVAATSLEWGAGTMGAVCLLLFATWQKSWAAYGLIVLATVELFSFANQNFTTTQSDLHYPTGWLDAVRASPGDYRVVNSALPGGAEVQFLDAGMSLGIQNLWGYDPGVLKRYAQTLAASQGIDPDQANQYVQVTRGSLGLFQMLRCRYALLLQGNTPTVQEITSPLPVAQLVPNWVVKESRDATFAAINSNDFDPRKVVMLESPPGIEQIDSGVGGPVEVVAQGNDWIELETSTPAPTMLLITNNYSSGWRVIPIEPTAQTDYKILPADHTLMAIPLQAGTHHFRIEYLPMAFRVGKWISIIALLGYACTLGTWLSVRRRAMKSDFFQLGPQGQGPVQGSPRGRSRPSG